MAARESLTSEEKRQLLRRIISDHKPPLSPLSYNQEALFYQWLRAPGSIAYNATFVVRIEGLLDADAFRRTIDSLHIRHSILRTVYQHSEASVHQKVISTARPDFEHLYCADWVPGRLEAELESERRRPFDLTTGPVMRLRLYSTAEDQHLLLVCAHHICIDYWSFGILLNDIVREYGAIRSGHPRPEPRPGEYGGHATQQRKEMGGPRGDQLWQYWKSKLEALEPLNLPLDRPRPKEQSFRGETLMLDLPPGVLDELKLVAQRQGTTLFCLFLAAYFALLYRYSGQERFAVGSPVTGRISEGAEDILGYFANLVVLQADLSKDLTLGDLLHQLSETVLDAMDHQEIPFPLLAQKLGVVPQPNRNALCDVLFGWEKLHLTDHAAAGELRLQVETVKQMEGSHDLILLLFEHPDRISLSFQYATDLFEAETIRAFADQYIRMLRAFARDLSTRVAATALTSEEEHRKITQEWAGQATSYPREASVPELFGQVCRQHPDNIALVAGRDTVDYRTLNGLANRMASALLAAGLREGEPVALCMHRSVHNIAATLAILKAGGVYVPLDPEYPAERFKFMLEDVGARLGLTSSVLRPLLPSSETVWLDCIEISESAASDPEVDVMIPRNAEDLAYIMYTSGSTGQPKGVPVPHRGIVRLVRETHFMEFGPDEVFLELASTSFDAATWEIWGPLLNGGRLVVLEQGAITVESLKSALTQQCVTSLFLTTALFNLLVESGISGLRDLRQLLFGGERVSVPHVEKALEVLPTCRLIHCYGPTENTTFTTCHTISSVRVGQWTTIPIGPPISNTRVYVLDDQLQPVPDGIPGELYCGGDGLALGYWRRPDLTAQRFLDDPFLPGQRMYKTGDLVRWLRDGTIEYLERIDAQVKIRGFRIEPGEIESALLSNGLIRQAVVVAREDRPGDKRLVAYVTSDHTAELKVGDIKQRLAVHLPAYMIPSAIVVMDTLPLTPNGKIDKRALPAPALEHPESEPAKPASERERIICDIWAKALGLPAFGRNDNVFDAGGNSLLLIDVHAKLQQALGVTLKIVDLFHFATPASLAAHLGEERQPLPTPAEEIRTREPLAIIAMAGRFPGADSPEALWDNLRNGVEAVRTFTDEELRTAGVEEWQLRDPQYVRAGAPIEAPEQFDAAFFGFTPREAEVTDPQHRLFLQHSHEALERAGYDPRTYAGRIGVFAGATSSSYLIENLLEHPELADSVSGLQRQIGNDNDFLASRVAYKLNLRGPAVNVQTACSTSLVAVHLAGRSLLENSCDLALAGGVSVRFPIKRGYQYQADAILSPDGHCRPFDEQAQGTVGGHGVGVVVLKRLSAALADGDQIHAVILSTAINNDGSDKIGFTAPSVDGQAAVIAAAQSAAGVTPDSIAYIEAHGTGTKLGDPIEIAALGRVFGETSAERIAIGSIKSNVGHLDAAAGITGLIKTAMQLQHGKLLPSLHYSKPNPELHLEASPFYVNTAFVPWPDRTGPRRAGVSSFGIGGTNAHAVLEAAPGIHADATSRRREWQVLTLSAKSQTALQRLSDDLLSHLRRCEADLADVAYTLHVGRTAHPFRRTIVASTREEAGLALESTPHPLPGRASESPSVVFMFPGQGSQYAGMSRGLYQSEPVFRETLDRCAQLLELHLGLDIRILLHAFSGTEEQLRETQFAQPALFAVEYSLAKLWISWGITPEAMIGHSVGEYVAACLAGVMTLEQALELIVLRGRLIQGLPPGSMIALPLAEADARTLANGSLSIAAVNAPLMCVVSGRTDDLDALDQRLTAQGVQGRRLHTSHAFHSAMMDPALDEFTRAVGKFTFRPPQIPYVSNLTGTWITAEQATDPHYWAAHLRNTVRFADGIAELSRTAGRVFLEVGPGVTLSSLAKSQLSSGHSIVPSLGKATEVEQETKLFAHAVARMWESGVSIEWPAYHHGERRLRVLLPTYPFETQRYWIEPARNAALTATTKLPPEKWLYSPAWTRSHGPAQTSFPEPIRVVVIAEDAGLGEQVQASLSNRNASVIVVSPQKTAGVLTADRLTFRWDVAEDYRWLLSQPQLSGAQHFVYIPSSQGPEQLDTALYRPLMLLQALHGRVAQVTFISKGALDVTGTETLSPEAAAILGLCKSAEIDCAGLRCRVVDFDGPAQVSAITDEILAGTEDAVAYRAGRRWLPAYTPMVLAEATDFLPVASDEVAVIVGGSGELGQELARWLAQTSRCKLGLISRSKPKTEFLEQLRELGSTVGFFPADASDPATMRDVFEQIENALGPVKCVIYAAGTKVFKPVSELSQAECELQFRTKAAGLRVLEEVLEGRNVSHCLIISSLATLLGVNGFGAYAAAHQYCDTFVARHNRTATLRWTLVNLDNWMPGGAATRGPGTLEFSLSRDEGIAVFRKILAGAWGEHVVVSTGDLGDRVRSAKQPRISVRAPGPHAHPKATERRRVSNEYVAPRTHNELVLAAIWQELLGINPVGVHDDLFELGGDSVLSLQIVSRANRQGLRITPKQVFEFPTIAGIAAALSQSSSGPEAEQGLVEGFAPLTPIQRWFFDQDFPQAHHFNQAFMLRVSGHCSPAHVRAALEALMRHHDALRMQYYRQDEEWRQYNAPALEALWFQNYDVATLAETNRTAEIERLANELQRDVILGQAPMLRAAHFVCGPNEPARLLLVIHHLSVDLISWRILFEDLESALAQIIKGATPLLPAKTTSFCRWADLFTAHIQGGGFEAELDYWTTPARKNVDLLPRDFNSPGVGLEKSIQRVSQHLTSDVTRSLIHNVPPVFKTQIDDVLLWALARTIRRWAGSRSVLVDIEATGREALAEQVDLSRTVGWFTSVYPLLLELPEDTDPIGSLHSVRDQRRLLPNKGIGYGALRFLSPVHAATFAQFPPAQICFLYGGQSGVFPNEPNQLIRWAGDPAGEERAPDLPCSHPLTVYCAIEDGCLQVQFIFSDSLHRRETMQMLATWYLEELRAIVKQTEAPPPRKATAADFEAARISDRDFKHLASKLQKRLARTAE